MYDKKLETEENQRTANYETIQTDIKREVGREITSKAERKSRADSSAVENVADDLREKAVREIVSTEREIEVGRALARFSQIVDYIFFIIYGLLGIRLLLALFAARSGADFVQFIRSVTEPFYAPFRGIVPSPSIEGGFTLALPIVVALFVYVLLHLAVNGFFRIFVHRKTTV
ncbi:MAG: YggT family protein [Pyrinomonadaceae bacterium]